MANVVDITRDIGKIFQHGGGRIMLAPCDENGVTEASQYMEDLGYIEDFEINDETPLEPIVDETGNTIKQIEGTRSVKITATLMQVSKDTLDFFSNLTGQLTGKYYNMYTLRSRETNLEGDSYQEIVAGICKIKPMVNVRYPGQRLPIEIEVLYNQNAVTLNNSTTNGIFYLASPTYATKATGSLVTPAGKYWITYETDA